MQVEEIQKYDQMRDLPTLLEEDKTPAMKVALLEARMIAG
jgi:hypothetical protein